MRQRKCYTKQQVIRFLENRFEDVDFSEVEKVLPPIVWRHRWNDLADKFGLPYRRGYLQNLDSEGLGPGSIQA